MSSVRIHFDIFVFHSNQYLVDATNIEMHGLTTDKIIKSGQTIAVECILKGGNPLGKIIWYKGRNTSRIVVIILKRI